MANLAEEMNTEYAIFEEEEKKEYFVVPMGTYPAHAWSLNLKHRGKKVKSRNVTGKFHVADIYELEYRLADEISKMNVPEAKKISGKIIRSNGVFVFKDPNGEKDCVPNPSGNWQYSNLLKVFGINLEEKDVDDGKGGKKTVKILPRLSEDKIKGKPCMITVKHREWENNTYANVNRVDKWEQGKDYVGDDINVPF